jgi:predicted transcriptional regulator
MTKSDRIGTVLRKFDYLWSKKNKTFCDVVKEICGGEFKDLSDEEITTNLKNIEIDKQHKE